MSDASAVQQLRGSPQLEFTAHDDCGLISAGSQWKGITLILMPFASMSILFLTLTVLLSLVAGRQDRPAIKCAAGPTLHAADRPAADEGASSTKPVISSEGFKKPSQQPQQRPGGSSHAPALTSEREMAQGSAGRPPGMNAPTSEKYAPDSVQHLTLQVLWHKCNFSGEAAFRVYVAISVVLSAAAESAEQLKQAVSRVGVLLNSNLVKI